MNDTGFLYKYLPTAKLLWGAAEGCADRIPDEYAEHLSHTYLDGDVSFGVLLPKVEDYSELDDFQIEEAIELLGKISPEDWPNIEDIEGVSLEELLHVYDEDASKFDFVEDNLSTGERVEKVLIEVISSVFGDRVSTIRSEKNYYASPKNNFLQEDDGTFAGTFMYDGKRFIFEVYPDEQGWGVTYRLHWKDVENLPPVPDEDGSSKNDYTRRVRHRGWK